MKIIGWMLVLLLSLSGCAATDTFETLGDVDAAPAVQQGQDMIVSVPDPAEVMQGDYGTMYLCDDYTVTVQVKNAGDLNGTVKALSGFGTDELTVISTAAGEMSRYECVWTAAGEGGDCVGRALVLDDGAFHYCITMEYGAENAVSMEEVWQEITDSVVIE